MDQRHSVLTETKVTLLLRPLGNEKDTLLPQIAPQILSLFKKSALVVIKSHSKWEKSIAQKGSECLQSAYGAAPVPLRFVKAPVAVAERFHFSGADGGRALAKRQLAFKLSVV